MCGIVGIIPKNSISKENIQLFKEALYVDALRGWDGTGVLAVNHQYKPNVIKTASVPGVLIHKINSSPFSFWGRLLVGHNRAATRGISKEDNSHPFQEKHITLVHNGTLSHHKHLAEVDVDSHAICHALTEMTPQELVNEIYGAYALVWYDEKEQTINLLRNKERPLHLFETKDFWFFCSEKNMGIWLLSRSNIHVLNEESIKEDTLYTVNLTDKQLSITQTECKPTVKLVEKKSEQKKAYGEADDELWKAFYEDYLKSHFNIVEDDLIEVVFNSVSSSNMSNIKKYSGHLFADKTFKVKIYTEKDFPFNKAVEVTYKHLNKDGDSFALYCSAFNPKENELSLVTPYTTFQGAHITKDIHNKLLGKKCEHCHSIYSPSKDIGLNVKIMGGSVLNYTFTCPKCTKDLHKEAA